MEKIRFSAEKLATCPLNNGKNYVDESGCGCAFGIGYYAAYGCFNGLSIGEKSANVADWRNKIGVCLRAILQQAESRLLSLIEDKEDIYRINHLDYLRLEFPNSDIWNVTTVEGVRKWMIDKLNAAGYLDTSEVKQECTV